MVHLDIDTSLSNARQFKTFRQQEMPSTLTTDSHHKIKITNSSTQISKGRWQLIRSETVCLGQPLKWQRNAGSSFLGQLLNCVGRSQNPSFVSKVCLEKLSAAAASL